MKQFWMRLLGPVMATPLPELMLIELSTKVLFDPRMRIPVVGSLDLELNGLGRLTCCETYRTFRFANTSLLDEALVLIVEAKRWIARTAMNDLPLRSKAY